MGISEKSLNLKSGLYPCHQIILFFKLKKNTAAKKKKDLKSVRGIEKKAQGRAATSSPKAVIIFDF